MLAGLELGTLADNQHFQRTMRAGALLSRLRMLGSGACHGVRVGYRVSTPC